MAKLDQHGERITKKRWLRALRLAKLLFDDQAYSADYLIEIEELIKDIYLGPNDPAIQLPLQWNFMHTSKGHSQKNTKPLQATGKSQTYTLLAEDSARDTPEQHVTAVSFIPV